MIERANNTLQLNQRKTKQSMKVSQIFLFSALFFSFFSLFGVYSYRVYSVAWFVMYYIYELLFYFGLRSGIIVIGDRKNVRKQCIYRIHNNGATLLWVLCCLAIASFVFFLCYYISTMGGLSFGTYTADVFSGKRTIVDKIALVVMQIGGDAAFLVLAIDNSGEYKALKRLSCITLFLPGIRYTLMGARFALAVEFLMLLFVKWPDLKNKIKSSAHIKKTKRLIICMAFIIGIVFLYLFATRMKAASYTALERKAFIIGDMKLKPVWMRLYDVSGGKIEFLCSLSDYLAESPYIFAYSCKYKMPDRILFGALLFRAVFQIVNNLTGLGLEYANLLEHLASGQYNGFAYSLIADFGIVGSFFAAYFIGVLFSKIERNIGNNKYCAVAYPAIKVSCFFAPIFYFYVGRIDYTILFALILAGLCLTKRNVIDE